ncbi:hypothetical protein [Chitinivorax sp. B]|uniref:hypothetical protein n=1 Tax=Chitinivorax sp. B TaxID=2502235 RepID=UPI001484E992|nr:hypothetical protein [Chitinivorax sp. B]
MRRDSYDWAERPTATIIGVRVIDFAKYREEEIIDVGGDLIDSYVFYTERL